MRAVTWVDSRRALVVEPRDVRNILSYVLVASPERRRVLDQVVSTIRVYEEQYGLDNTTWPETATLQLEVDVSRVAVMGIAMRAQLALAGHSSIEEVPVTHSMAQADVEAAQTADEVLEGLAGGPELYETLLRETA